MKQLTILEIKVTITLSLRSTYRHASLLLYYLISMQVYLSGASTEWHHRKNAWKIQRTW